MSPQTPQYPGDPVELLTYLQAAREDRKRIARRSKAAAALAIAALIAVAMLFIRFHANQISGCERGRQSAALQARLAENRGYHEDARKAAARARLDCHAAYPWF